MQVLCHHLYEYQKGLRPLVLHTMKSKDRAAAEAKLQSYDVDYLVIPVSTGKINIFFGCSECVDVVRSFGAKPLNQLTLEQDFILGTMLGYDRQAQCERYLQRSKQQARPIAINNGAIKINLNNEFYPNVGIA